MSLLCCCCTAVRKDSEQMFRHFATSNHSLGLVIQLLESYCVGFLDWDMPYGQKGEELSILKKFRTSKSRSSGGTE